MADFDLNSVTLRHSVFGNRATTIRPGEGGTPLNGLYGEAPPEGGIFFRLQVYKKVGISRATYMKG